MEPDPDVIRQTMRDWSRRRELETKAETAALDGAEVAELSALWARGAADDAARAVELASLKARMDGFREAMGYPKPEPPDDTDPK